MLIEPFRESLLSYAPADERERGFRARMLELAGAAAPFERAGFVPGHFTASAFVIEPVSRSLLLILHKKLGLWLQPGGHIDAGDASVVDAARREVTEETGVSELLPLFGEDAVFDLDIHRIPARKSEPVHEHFDVRFAFAAREPKLVESDEVEGARFIPLEDVARVTSDESVLRAVRKLLASGRAR